MSPRGYACVLGILALGLMPSPARAQPGSDAEQAFDRGREMLKIGKYAEACTAFADSQRLAPQLETQFNIALCSEQLGKLATALALHRELAESAPNPQRRAMSADLVTQLEARVPSLRIAIVVRDGRPPPGLVVRVGEVEVANLDRHPLDLGTSQVVATAPGFERWTGQVIAKVEGASVAVTIPLVRDGEARSSGEPPAPPSGLMPRSDPPDEPRAGAGRKTLATVSLVAGGLGLGAGVTFGLLARSTWTEAKDVCGGGTTCATPDQLARANALTDDARVRGNVSTISMIAGGALLLGGIVLWVTAPDEAGAIAITPSVGPSSATVRFEGRF